MVLAGLVTRNLIEASLIFARNARKQRGVFEFGYREVDPFEGIWLRVSGSES
jgi:hypothetical protein